MKQEIYLIKLEHFERDILINMLNNIRNDQLKSGENTEIMNDILIKVISAKTKKFYER